MTTPHAKHLNSHPLIDTPIPEWCVSEGLVEYRQAEARMLERVQLIRQEQASELIWLVEHPPLYTAGTSARADDVKDRSRFDIYETGRGGQYTYHGPGQRVVYLMLNLQKRDIGVREYVRRLEGWIAATLHVFGLHARCYPERVGVWVDGHNGIEAKIAAIGIRIQKGISLHGIAINVHPDLSHYGGIVPCGLPEYDVTSLQALSIDASINDLDAVLQSKLNVLLGARETNPDSLARD